MRRGPLFPVPTSIIRKKKKIKFAENYSRFNLVANRTYQQQTMTGVLRTIIPKAQADTGANVSATNDRTLIFNYKKFPKPVPVQVFAENVIVYAEGYGFLKIISFLLWIILTFVDGISFCPHPHTAH